MSFQKQLCAKAWLAIIFIQISLILCQRTVSGYDSKFGNGYAVYRYDVVVNKAYYRGVVKGGWISNFSKKKAFILALVNTAIQQGKACKGKNNQFWDCQNNSFTETMPGLKRFQ